MTSLSFFVSPGLSPKCLQRYQQTKLKEFCMLSVKTKVRPISRHFHHFSRANPLTNDCI